LVIRGFDLKKYRTILIDPPWEQEMTGSYKQLRKNRRKSLPYPTMTLEEIKHLPIEQMAETGCHLWLWTTNQYLEPGFMLMREWGFKYLAPIHWVKPSGLGNWFIHRTQTVLFGYYKKCEFPLGRYRPNIIETGCPTEHSAKPDQTYRYIESISPPNRLEIFARPWTPMFPKRDGWDTWGNEMPNDIDLIV
jgi:N6-adenosine-specific RNA methylase IME4